MNFNAISSTCVLLVFTCYLSTFTDAMPSGGAASRHTRQAPPFPPGPGNRLQEFPVKIAGGHNAYKPSVGALSSVPLYQPFSVSDRQDPPAPPVVFGPRPTRPRPQTFSPQNYYDYSNFNPYTAFSPYSNYYNWYSPYGF